MSRYETKSTATVLYLGRGRPKRIKWVLIIVIILIIVIFFPIYGTTLRYDVGFSFRFIFSTIGDGCLMLGLPLIIMSIILSIFSRRFYLKSFILGIVLLWVGAFLTDTQYTLFGYLFGQNSPQQGYH